MRRLAAILAVTVYSLCAPARAEAVFWHWLDNLSGPQFKGWEMDWRVWCSSDNALIRTWQEADSDLDYYRATEHTISSPEETKRLYVETVQKAMELAKSASLSTSGRESRRLAVAARAALAEARSMKLERDFSKAGLKPDPLDAIVGAVDFKRYNFTGGGAVLSLCNSKRYDLPRTFLSVNVGFGYGKEKGDYAPPVGVPSYGDLGLRMVTVGASFHKNVLPGLALGIGGGVAFFSSTESDGFQKAYVQPLIVDWKPLLSRKNADLTDWWSHLAIARYNMLSYPTGFGPSQFRAGDPRFPAEIVHSLGIYADLEPLVRRLTGHW